MSGSVLFRGRRSRECGLASGDGDGVVLRGTDAAAQHVSAVAFDRMVASELRIADDGDADLDNAR
jgi:hypothetical protein